MKKFVLLIFALGFLAAACNAPQAPLPPAQKPALNSASTTLPAAPSPIPKTTSSTSAQLSNPVSGGLVRVTKKPFGIYITPQTSPVQPEKFTGYHTGIDFETTPAEQNIDVPVLAACDGKLLLKKYASGYGGVAVQACLLNGANVTIIYGHLRLSSITPNIGDTLKAEQQIAVLGTGYSAETNGERKHLHFGIHKGAAINILGYVQKQADLGGWLDPAKYLP